MSAVCILVQHVSARSGTYSRWPILRRPTADDIDTNSDRPAPHCGTHPPPPNRLLDPVAAAKRKRHLITKLDMLVVIIEETKLSNLLFSYQNSIRF